MNATIDITSVTLKTERLILRPWKESDLDDFFAYASVDGVGQMAGWQPHKTKEDSKVILSYFIDGKHVFAVEMNGKVIGSFGVEAYDEKEFPELQDKRCRELGYVLSKDYWGRGLMAEAGKAVIKYLFDEVKLDCILCGNFLENRQSARVQEKLGFEPIKQVLYHTRMGEEKPSQMNILWNQEIV